MLVVALRGERGDDLLTDEVDGAAEEDEEVEEHHEPSVVQRATVSYAVLSHCTVREIVRGTCLVGSDGCQLLARQNSFHIIQLLLSLILHHNIIEDHQAIVQHCR